MRWATLMILVVWLPGACARSDLHPLHSVVKQSVSLHLGETVRVEGSLVEVTFQAVSGDSRCPEDVTCIWAGDATVRLELEGDAIEARTEIELHTHPERQQEARIDGWSVRLLSLKPMPRSTDSMEERQYVADLEIAGKP